MNHFYRLWTSIVESFNAGSGRAMPSTKDSLTKLASRMQSGCRKDAGNYNLIKQVIVVFFIEVASKL